MEEHFIMNSHQFSAKVMLALQKEKSDLLIISDVVEGCVLVSNVRCIILEAVAKGLTASSSMLDNPVQLLASKPNKKRILCSTKKLSG